MSSQQPVSELFMNNIYVLPLWVKQVLYFQTRDRLNEELSEFVDILNNDPLIQFYIPKLTFAGKNELTMRQKRLPGEFYTFYENIAAGSNLFEVTISNYWTFAQTCSILIRSMELQFVNIPDVDTIIATAQFMAGKIRTGEMLKKLGKIDVIQLEKALRIQKERAEQGRHIKMAELMIELGYITDKDVKILLVFKEDAQRRFVMGIGFNFVKPNNEHETQMLVRNMQKEIKRLDEENRILKSRLRKILNIKE